MYSIIISSLMFGFGWKTSYQKQSGSHGIQLALVLKQSTEIDPLDIVQEMIGQVDQDRALTDFKRLTDVKLICSSNGYTTIIGYETGSEELQWAKNDVYETLVSLHYSVEVLDWSLSGYTDQISLPINNA